MTSSHKKNINHAGLTMVELLVTIVVIAVITAYAIPQFSGIGHQAETNSAKRNAQILAAAAENARTAGNAEIADAKDADEVIDLLEEGLEGEGIFEGTLFKVQLDADQRRGALPYLKFDPAGLVYDPNQVD